MYSLIFGYNYWYVRKAMMIAIYSALFVLSGTICITLVLMELYLLYYTIYVHIYVAKFSQGVLLLYFLLSVRIINVFEILCVL